MTTLNKTMLGILKVLERHQDTVMGSRELSKQLKLHGIDLSERTVRYHLKIMDERGFTQVFGKEGRKITPLGLKELKSSYVSERVGFTISKIEALSYLTSFDLVTEKGEIILNISFFPEAELKKAVKIMAPVFSSPYVMSDRVVILREGEKIGDIIVPEGRVALGTVCSVTINGIFLKNGIPMVSKFGGILEVEEEGPTRFVSLISYEGSSIDPLVIFIRSKMTYVNQAIKENTGRVLASFREIPIVSLEKAYALEQTLRAKGIGGIQIIGNPNQPLLEMPVGIDKAGVVVIGGLNPIAALEETGIPTENDAMSTLYPYTSLLPFKDAIADL